MKFQEVVVQTSSSLNQPCVVLDYSQPIIEEVSHEVSEIKEGMIVLSERFNPFMKTIFYSVKETKCVGYKIVGRYFDYRVAVSVAKKYAKENNLKYTK